MAMTPSSKFERMKLKPSQAMAKPVKPAMPMDMSKGAKAPKAPKATARLNAMKKMAGKY